MVTKSQIARAKERAVQERKALRERQDKLAAQEAEIDRLLGAAVRAAATSARSRWAKYKSTPVAEFYELVCSGGDDGSPGSLPESEFGGGVGSDHDGAVGFASDGPDGPAPGVVGHDREAV